MAELGDGLAFGWGEKDGIHLNTYRFRRHVEQREAACRHTHTHRRTRTDRHTHTHTETETQTHPDTQTHAQKFGKPS